MNREHEFIKKIMIENVGIADVMPRIQLEVIVNEKTKFLEPILAGTNAYEFKERIETQMYDERHNLDVTKEDEKYILTCPDCNYKVELREAEKIIEKTI